MSVEQIQVWVDGPRRRYVIAVYFSLDHDIADDLHCAGQDVPGWLEAVAKRAEGCLLGALVDLLPDGAQVSASQGQFHVHRTWTELDEIRGQ